ncbi:MAG TPA: M20/M25/M40 family metallo-hydrolase [Bryobacteraceae bacterium]|nr:M20/M25/M40 family metallo-hydrolase [Bryobacteraceae bacterium]
MKTLIGLLLFPCAFAQLSPEHQAARDILKQLVEINTTDSSGNVTQAADAMAQRFRDAGFAADDVKVLAPVPKKGNLVVRFHGLQRGKPVLFLAHLDVVEARRSDWSFDPFRLTERDGWFYGRGTSDDKDGDADLVANFIRLKKEGFTPDRDLILALTADEEGGDYNGMDWLLKNHSDILDATFCINTDAGGGELKNSKRISFDVQGAEKGYQSFRFTVTNSGGHSSLPRKDNAIDSLAAALVHLQGYTFPMKLNNITRGFFETMSSLETGQTARDMKAVAGANPPADAISRLSESPYYNALLRTTCVPTMLSGGHAENALPQDATAIVNCRLVPDDTREGVTETLERLIHDQKVSVTPYGHPPESPSSVLTPEIRDVIQKVVDGMWPGIPILPVMVTGGTDGRPLRLAGIPTFGVSGIWADPDDERAHGRDERVNVQAFYDSVDFYYRLIREFGTQQLELSAPK